MNKNIIKNILIIVLLILLIFKSFRPEIITGFCLDESGNGIELNPETLQPIHPYYNYIKYNPEMYNNYVKTILIYNPFNNYCDDIIFRYDIKCNVSRETYNNYYGGL